MAEYCKCGVMSLLRVLWMLGSPPFGKKFWDVYLSQNGRPLGPKLRHDVPNRNGSQATQRALLGVRNIVISIRQKAHTHKPACRRAGEVGKREGIVPGIGLVNKGESDGVSYADESVIAAGRNIAGILMQRNLSE